MDAKNSADLHGLDPRELLMRGLANADARGQGNWTPPSVEELAPLFPAYEIQALIGRGGMGAVYRARQPALDRLVAIKLLPLEISVEEEIAERFRREARALARLQHPHIIAVHEFGTTSEGHLFFVMEYVEGTDLAALLRGRRLVVTQVLDVVRQICEALQFAHAHGVIHRDIKPANVLVDAAGCVKVGDFGLAKLAQAGEALDESSAATAALGTPDYTAPEQWRGEADHRADIYSLGVMFYEMLTGEMPQGVFDPPSKKVPVDSRLDPVVLRAMQEAPERRYQQAGELRDDVVRVGAPSRSRLANFTIFAAIVLLGATGIFVWKKGESRRVASSAEKRPSLNSQPSEAAVHGTEAAAHGTSGGRSTGERSGGRKMGEPTLNPPVWTNGLGMKFVPLGADGLKICVWETRVRDFEEFATQTGYVTRVGMLTIEGGKLTTTNRTWREPGFAQTPDDPVCGVDWKSAVTFCQWLTERELAQKRLTAESRYRLPTDAEWNLACGITENSVTGSRYPWGSVFPPPEGAGNYAGVEVLADPWPSERPPIRGYRDRFRRTAPVGSSAPNALGIFDLGGNVWEWTDDGPQKDRSQRWVRGGSWLSSSARVLDSGFHTVSPLDARNSAFGFRIVLAPR